MPPVTVLAVDHRRLFRDAIKVFLNGSAFSVVAEAPDISEAITCLNRVKADLIVVGDASWTPEKVRLLRDLKAADPAARLVLLGEDMSRDCIEEALSAGADGCLGKNVSPRALLSYLGLVMSGEKVVPFEIARQAMGNAPARSDGTVPPRGLSRREVDILARMARGEPNKVIARRMSLTEGTVKAHVKSILRKVAVQNRTQAALWAIRSGLASAESDS